MSDLYPFNPNPLERDLLVDIPYHERILEQTKWELKEMATKQADLIDLGPIMGETPKEHWTGSISLEQRLTAGGDLTSEEVDEAVAHLNEYFVPVAKGAPKRCVDGRTIEGYEDNDPAWYGRGLGPQVQGGTEGDVIGRRLAKGYQEGTTYLADLRQEVDKGASEYAPGGHTGSNASPKEGKTDCGQRDGEERRLSTYTGVKLDTVSTVLSSVYTEAGLIYPKENVSRLSSNAQSLAEHQDQYFGDKEKAMDILRAVSPQALEFLMNKHNEATLTINLVPYTTFHRDHYNARTNGKIQNFNLDAWDIVDEHGEDAFFVLADAVNTLMDLTDGSIRVCLRVPKQKVPEPQTA